MKLTKLERLPKLAEHKRVAAYARVSTEKLEALSSLANQIEHYRKMFANNPNYILVGVFSDNGISGAKSARPQFKKMLEMAKNGEIDLIYTKSISRFSRNLINTLEIIRELKAIDVGIYFEEQNMNTLDPKSEFILHLLSIFAESELKSMSGNMRWRIIKDFEEGKLWGGCNHYGYKMINRRYIVDPETAPAVKLIYEKYLSGMGTYSIARIMNEMNIPTIKGGKWNNSTVLEILTNRNYTGDLVLQRTFKKDYKSGSVLNRGQVDSFVVEDDHEPIIDKDTYLKVQIIRAQKAKKHKTEVQKQKIIHEFSDLLVCENCGHFYRYKKSPYQCAYVCATFMNYGKDKCQSKQIREDVLFNITKKVLNIEEVTRDELLKRVKQIIVKKDNILTFILKNGKEENVHWDDPKRSESWTPEMKEKMRISSSKIVMVREKNGHFLRKGELNANSN